MESLLCNDTVGIFSDRMQCANLQGDMLLKQNHTILSATMSRLSFRNRVSLFISDSLHSLSASADIRPKAIKGTKSLTRSSSTVNVFNRVRLCWQPWDRQLWYLYMNMQSDSFKNTPADHYTQLQAGVVYSGRPGIWSGAIWCGWLLRRLAGPRRRWHSTCWA